MNTRLDWEKALTNELGDRVKKDKNIAPYLTLRNTVTAQYFFEAESRDDLKKAVKITTQNNIPLFLLGGGSNTAIMKDRLEGVVVRNLYQRKEIVQETDKTVDLLISSGYSVARLVSETVNAGYEGLEYHFGLPGTVGGAIYMNSKWTKPVSYFGDSLEYAWLIDKKGNEKKVMRDYFQFAYDYSMLQETKEFVLEVVFKLKKNDPEVLKKRAKESVDYRKATQPIGIATCGCFFRNISDEEQKNSGSPTKSAGYLIDRAGLKGLQYGDFVVSDKHANFIINTSGKGNSTDLKKLIDEVKSKVQERFGIELEEEVIVV